MLYSHAGGGLVKIEIQRQSVQLSYTTDLSRLEEEIRRRRRKLEENTRAGVKGSREPSFGTNVLMSACLLQRINNKPHRFCETARAGHHGHRHRASPVNAPSVQANPAFTFYQTKDETLLKTSQQ